MTKILNFQGEKHVLSDDDIDVEASKETEIEMNSINQMIKHATKQGLLTEVIWTALQNNSDNIPTKCRHALNEWDC